MGKDYTGDATTGEQLVVLAVDDNEDDLTILRHYLTRMEGLRVQVRCAHTLAEVWDILESDSVDLAILDYRMGVHTGLDVFSEMQVRGVDVPAILVTDQGDEEVAVEAMHLGFSDYIPKTLLGIQCLRRAILNAVEKFRLRQSLAQHNDDLRSTLRKLKTRNEEIQNFYHSLSHELKTPLTAIREFLSIVLDRLQGPLTQDQEESLQTAKKACDHMTVCINDLLDATRLDTGKLTLKRRRQPVLDTLKSAIKECESASHESGIEVQLDCEADCEAFFDESRILQVAVNLIGNALKFTGPEGHVKIRVRPSDKVPGFLEVSVEDNGRGIAEVDKEQIFDRLFQASSGDAAAQGGLGIGLNLCRELVDLHGGRIDVETEVGQGSTFTFTLPMDEVQRSETPTRAAA